MNNTQSFSTGLTESIAQGDWRLMFLEHDRLKDVSRQDIVLRTVVPETSDLNVTLASYKSVVTIAQSETFDPTPSNIEVRLTRETKIGYAEVVTPLWVTVSATSPSVVESGTPAPGSAPVQDSLRIL